MKIDKIQYCRLVIPILLLASGYVLQNELLKGMGVGYFYCWIFGLQYEKEESSSKNSKANKK